MKFKLQLLPITLLLSISFFGFSNSLFGAYTSPSFYITQNEKQIQNKIADRKYSKRDKLALKILLARKLAVLQQLNRSQSILFALPKSQLKKLKLEGDYELCYAILLKYSNKKGLALESYFSALRIFKKEHKNLGQVDAWIELMEYYRKFQMYNEGLAISQKIDGKIKQLQNVPIYYKLRHLNRKAAIISELGKKEEAGLISRKCIALAEKNKEWYLAAVSHNELGFSYFGIENDSCIKHLLIAQQLFRKVGSISDAIDTELNLYNLDAYYKNRTADQKYKDILLILKEIKENQIQYPQLIRLYEQALDQLGRMKQFEQMIKYKDLILEEHLRIAADNSRVEAAIIKNNKVIRSYKNENQRIKREKSEKETRLYYYFLAILGLTVTSIFVYFLYYERRKFAKKLQVENEIQQNLIKEIHHRVKNNLHFISSLIQMQERSLNSEELKGPLNDLFIRIQSMSTVHELLYVKDKTDFLLIHDYLLSLIHTLTSAKQFEIEYSISPDLLTTKIDSRNMMSIGIIITELYTNSVKYSLSKTANPKFVINVSAENDCIRFHIKDNGPGFEGAHSAGLGHRLIDIFSRQLKATHQLEGKDGMNFKLLIPNGKI